MPTIPYQKKLERYQKTKHSTYGILEDMARQKREFLERCDVSAEVRAKIYSETLWPSESIAFTSGQAASRWVRDYTTGVCCVPIQKWIGPPDALQVDKKLNIKWVTFDNEYKMVKDKPINESNDMIVITDKGLERRETLRGILEQSLRRNKSKVRKRDIDTREFLYALQQMDSDDTQDDMT